MEKSESGQKINTETERNMEKLPKTKFEQIDIAKEIELVNMFMTSSRWAIAFDKVYPELRKIQKENENEGDRLKKYREFMESIHTRDHEQMLSAQEQLQVEWEKIEQPYLQALSKHLETNWPIEKEEIVGYISALPAYPRFLRGYSFCVGYKNVANMIETAAHEILHFLWFKKWKEVFPDIDEKEFESPNLVWRLSEIMDPIILQCEPKIRELIKPQKWGYSSFGSIKIGEVGMTEYFKDVYMRSVAANDPFEATLRKLWDEAKLHEEEISEF